MLAVIALDGLSFQDFQSKIGGKLPFYTGHTHADATLQTRSLWAQVLTGLGWRHTGIVGYRQPFGSLIRSRIVFEGDLPICFPTSSKIPEHEQLLVNVPMLEPKGRLWLSDGTHQLSTSGLDKGDLGQQYLPRPFFGLGSKMCQRRQALNELLRIDLQRCAWVQALVRKYAPKLLIARLGFFDALGHLFGLDHRALADELGDIEQRLVELLDFLYERFDQLLVVSLHDFVECRSLIDINRALQAHGFLNYQKRRADSHLREEAASALGMFAAAAEPPPIDIERTLAVAITDGAIYLNRADRFADGILDGKETAAVQRAVTQLVMSEFGHLKLDLQTNGSRGPDLVLQVEQADFRGFPSEEAADQASLAVHGARGFVASKTPIPDGLVEPIRLTSLVPWLSQAPAN